MLKQCLWEGVDDRRQSSDHDESITAVSHAPFVKGKKHPDEAKLSGEGVASKKYTAACDNNKSRDYSSDMICNSGSINDGSNNNNRKRKPEDNKLNETIGSMKKKSTV